jgi:hypothetical protein
VDRYGVRVGSVSVALAIDVVVVFDIVVAVLDVFVVLGVVVVVTVVVITMVCGSVNIRSEGEGRVTDGFYYFHAKWDRINHAETHPSLKAEVRVARVFWVEGRGLWAVFAVEIAEGVRVIKRANCVEERAGESVFSFEEAVHHGWERVVVVVE